MKPQKDGQIIRYTSTYGPIDVLYLERTLIHLSDPDYIINFRRHMPRRKTFDALALLGYRKFSFHPYVVSRGSLYRRGVIIEITQEHPSTFQYVGGGRLVQTEINCPQNIAEDYGIDMSRVYNRIWSDGGKVLLSYRHNLPNIYDSFVHAEYHP